MATEQTAATHRLYKIAERTAWEAARRNGRFLGSADDVRDGYIHLSAKHQVAATLAKHFAGRGDLVLVEVDAASPGPALKWEAARDGALFPHLYAPLDMRWVRAEHVLQIDADGGHTLPLELRQC